MSQTHTANAGTKTSFSTILIPLVGILIIFGFGCLPPIEPITPMGMKVLGVFLGMIFLWSFSDLLWSSLLGIIALVMVGYAPLPKVLQMSFGNTVSCLILFALLLFGAIQDSGVTRYIARFFLTREIINGRPAVFNFIIIYATYIMAALSASILPPLIFMWAILYDILKEVGYSKGDKYTTLMVIGVFLGAISGQAAKPFTGSALMVAGAYEQVAQASLNYLQYMFFGWLMSTLCILAYALLIKFVFRPDMSRIADISIERFKRDTLPPMSPQQKIMSAALIGFFALVLAPSILPKTLPIVGLLAKIGPLGVCFLIIVALITLRVDGKPVMNFKAVAAKYVVWDIYILVCMAMVISAAMTAKGMGITEFIVRYLSPVLAGHSYALFLAISIIFCTSITQFANNGVMGVLFMPMLKIFSEQSGGSFEATAVILIFSLHVAILTPAASPFAAFLYGNKEWLDKSDVLKYGTAILLMCMALYIAVGIPLARMIYGS